MNIHNELIPKKKPVISLLGLSGSGKSTVALAVSERLAEDSVKCATIKKDAAIKALGSQGIGRGSKALEYIQGSKNDTNLHDLMNTWLHAALGENDLIFLEGGTRSERAREATMYGTEDIAALTIVRFEVSALSIIRRLHERRELDDRADDNLLIMAGKLAGQTLKDLNSRNQPFSNTEYLIINANRPLEQVVNSVEVIARQRLQ